MKTDMRYLCGLILLVSAISARACQSGELVVQIAAGKVGLKERIEQALTESPFDSVTFSLTGTFNIGQGIEIKRRGCARSVTIESTAGASVHGSRLAKCRDKTRGALADREDVLWCESALPDRGSITPQYYRAPYSKELTPRVNFSSADGFFLYPLTAAGAKYYPIENYTPTTVKVSAAHLGNVLESDSDLIVHGFFRNEFRDEFIPVSSVDPVSGVLRLATPPFYEPRQNQGRVRLEAWPRGRKIDGDTPSRDRIEFPVPRPDECEGSGCDMRIAVVQSLISVSGVSRVRIKGLVLSDALRHAIEVVGVPEVEIEGVNISRVWHTGIKVADVSKGRISRSHLENVGAEGIHVSGGDRKTLIPTNFEIDSNEIIRTGRIFLSGHPAIRIDGVGIRVTRNLIKEAPHSAIMFQGNDHLIESNTIVDVVKETGDAGAIYTGRDWAARGSVVSRNVLRDIAGVPPRFGTAIYLDDQASGVTVVNNSMSNVYRAVIVGGGRENVVTGNLAENCAEGLFFDARGLTWQSVRTADPEWNLRKRLSQVPYRGDAYRKYKWLSVVDVDDPGAPKRNTFGGNQFRCKKVDVIDAAAAPFYRDEVAR